MRSLRDVSPSRVGVLDVTLRDGGFLNCWNFGEEQVLNHVASLADWVDLIDVGHTSDDSARGLVARCPPQLLEKLAEPVRDRRARLGIMARPASGDVAELLEERQGLVDVVRLPASVAEPEPALYTCEQALGLGFQVIVHITSVSAFALPRIEQTVDRFRGGGAGVLVLSDSRGAMAPRQVESLVKAVRDRWDGELGFHARDNLGWALANSQAAVASGCRWIDASVCGFGIGGGNVDLGRVLCSCNQEESWRRDWHPVQPILEEARVNLGLQPPAGGVELYRLAATCNLRQEWVPAVRSAFPGWAERLMARLPRRPYHSLDEVFECLEQVAGETETEDAASDDGGLRAG